MNQKVKKFSSEESRLLWLLAAIQFISFAEFMVMMPLAPTLMREFNFTPSAFGLIVSSYTLCSGISAFICSGFIDKFDRRKSVLFLFGAFIIATLLCAGAWGYWSILLARCLSGSFSGVLSSQVQAIVGDKIAVEKRGEAMGIVFAAFSLATVFGVPLGLLLSNQFGWWAPFLFLGMAGVIVWIGVFRVLPSITGHIVKGGASALSQTVELFKVPLHLYCFLWVFLTVSAGFFVFPFISAYLVANVGIRESHLFLIYLCGGAITFVTSRLIGRAADRYGTGLVFRCCSLAAIVPILLMTELGASDLPLVILVSALLFTFVSGRMTPFMSLLTQVISPKIRGKFLSVNAAITNLSAAIGSYGASQIVGKEASGALTGFATSGLVSCGLILCSVLWSLGLPRTRSDVQPLMQPEVAVEL